MMYQWRLAKGYTNPAKVLANIVIAQLVRDDEGNAEQEEV